MTTPAPEPGTVDHPDRYEYVVHRPGHIGEIVHNTRHEAVGHAAILSRFSDDSFEVDARRKTRSPFPTDALWRGEITNDHEHVGWTLLYETRSFAADAGYLYALANHLDNVRVTTHSWHGEDYRRVGSLESSDESYPVYVGFDEDGDPIEHDANALQYRHYLNDLTYSHVTDSDGGDDAE